MALTMTIDRSAIMDATVCTIIIPHELQVESGRPPTHGEVGNSGIEAYWDEDVPWTSSVSLHPEGLAMKFLRLAWVCAVDEVGVNAWGVTARRSK